AAASASESGAQGLRFPSAEMSQWASSSAAETRWLSWAPMCVSEMETASAAGSLWERASARQSPRPRRRLLRRARSDAEKAERRRRSVAAAAVQMLAEALRSRSDAPAVAEQGPRRPREEGLSRSDEEREPRPWEEEAAAYLSVRLWAAESASW